MPDLQIVSDFSPAGDQPQAIDSIVASIASKEQYRTLLGVTGSGKTFTVANAVERLQRPALVISHNKTLAAQLFSEFQEFFPHNAVHYFVSFYDYYQPEAYLPSTDTYIEKDLLRNEEIAKYRMMATASLLTRKDVIIVASVSCIYGLGSPDEYKKQQVHIKVGDRIRRNNLIRDLIDIRYQRNDVSFDRGCIRARGDVIEIFPPYQDHAYRVELFGDDVDRIREINTLTGEVHDEPREIHIFPAYHYMTDPERVEQALVAIESELQDRIEWFIKNGKLLEAQRIEQRTRFDLEMIREVGACQGIENYSRHFDARQPGEPPFCLLNYFPDDFLVFIDESHVTIPQIRGMYNGDRARKQNLVEYGFRLPSALDNRPLRFEEFSRLLGPTTFITATPGPYELDVSGEIVEQIIRPTGLVDPVMRIHPTDGQIDNLISECRKRIEKDQRVLVTTLTKRMSEDLTEYLTEVGLRARYLHSEINTVERTEILRDLREGKFDILVGINLLREGLDLPEVALVAILDADKEGFLRSETALVQTAGRAARNVESEVILYADVITNSIARAMAVTDGRRERQLAHNAEHGITPTSIVKAVRGSLRLEENVDDLLPAAMVAEGPGGQEDAAAMLAHLEAEMREAAQALEFEKAASLRDQIQEIKEDYGL